jgi:hypothetical protein
MKMQTWASSMTVVLVYDNPRRRAVTALRVTVSWTVIIYVVNMWPELQLIDYCIAQDGCAMAQAVSRRPSTAEARVRSWVSLCGICGGQSGTGAGFPPEARVRSWVSLCGICGGQSDTGAGFPPSTSVFLCQYHSTGAPLLRKDRK